MFTFQEFENLRGNVKAMEESSILQLARDIAIFASGKRCDQIKQSFQPREEALNLNVPEIIDATLLFVILHIERYISLRITDDKETRLLREISENLMSAYLGASDKTPLQRSNELSNAVASWLELSNHAEASTLIVAFYTAIKIAEKKIDGLNFFLKAGAYASGIPKKLTTFAKMLEQKYKAIELITAAVTTSDRPVCHLSAAVHERLGAGVCLSSIPLSSDLSIPRSSPSDRFGDVRSGGRAPTCSTRTSETISGSGIASSNSGPFLFSRAPLSLEKIEYMESPTNSHAVIPSAERKPVSASDIKEAAAVHERPGAGVCLSSTPLRSDLSIPRRSPSDRFGDVRSGGRAPTCSTRTSETISGSGIASSNSGPFLFSRAPLSLEKIEYMESPTNSHAVIPSAERKPVSASDIKEAAAVHERPGAGVCLSSTPLRSDLSIPRRSPSDRFGDVRSGGRAPTCSTRTSETISGSGIASSNSGPFLFSRAPLSLKKIEYMERRTNSHAVIPRAERKPVSASDIKEAVKKAVFAYEAWYYRRKPGRGASYCLDHLLHTARGVAKAFVFEREIKMQSSPADIAVKINDFLNASSTRYFLHSFASYLLDELVKLERSPWSDIKVNSTGLYNRILRTTPDAATTAPSLFVG